MRILGAIFLFVGLACAAHADTVLMKNGDRLTGSIDHSDGKQLTLKTDYAGEINLQMSAVKQIVSESPVVVTTKDKKTVTGKLTMEGTNLDLATSNTGAVQVPLGDVTMVRSEAAQAAYEHSLHPGFIENWNGAAAIGFSLARGNSNTTNLSIGFNGARTTIRLRPMRRRSMRPTTPLAHRAASPRTTFAAARATTATSARLPSRSAASITNTTNSRT